MGKTECCRKWELDTGGGIKNDETITQALAREIQEELGVDIGNVADKPTYVWIFAGNLMWLVYEVSLASTNFQKNEYVASAGFYSVDGLLNANPTKLGYYCQLHKADLEAYLQDS